MTALPSLDLNLDALLGTGPSLGPAPRRRKPKRDGLSPEEADSLLKDLLQTGTGGLQYAAETLDKPGRAVRGLLAGRPGELLNLVPFADTLGLTDPEKATSGRDLLEKAGVLGANKPGLDAGDVAGFAAEVATDPLSFLSFGTTTALGKTAKAAGTATKGLLPSIRAGERSLVSAGIPFTGLSADFTGKAAADAVEGIGKVARRPFDAADRVIERAAGGKLAVRPLARTGDYLGRVGRAVFDPAVNGKVQPEEQALAELLNANRYGTERAYTSAARDAARTLDDAAAGLGESIDRPAFDRLVRHASETDPVEAAKLIPGMPGLRAAAKAGEAAATLKATRDEAYESLRSLGGSGKLLGEGEEDLISHFPRGVDPSKLPEGAAVKGRGLDVTGYGAKGAKGREDALRNVPTDVLNRIAADPYARGKSGPDYILTTYGDALDPNYGRKLNLKGEVVVAGDPVKHAKALSKWVKDKPLAEWFNRGALEDHSRYMRGVETARNNVEAVQKFVAQNVSSDPAGVPLARLYSATPGFDKARSLEYVASQIGVDPKAAAKLTVPREVADAIAGAMKPLVSPTGAGRELLKGLDAVVNVTKKYLTLPFPKFHVRNLVGGQYINLASGLFKTPAEVKAYLDDVAAFAAGKVDPQYLEEMRTLRVLGGDVTEGLTRESADDLLRAGFGDRRAMQDVQIGKTPGAGPTSLPGKVVAAPVRAGEWAARRVETMNRGPLYVALRKRGYNPEAAALEVKARQFDYSQMTPVEREALKRVFPFYAWMRNSTELVLKTIAQRPGGAMAQTVRAGESGRKEAGFLPDWLGETAAIPVPGNPDRFLTKFGLPTDDVFGRFAGGPTPLKTIQRTTEKAISNMNPLLGLAYSAASGREPYFGRPLNELYRYPTDDVLTNLLLSKTPASRVIGTTRTVGDERKGLGAKAFNLLAPANLTDVSGGIERQRTLSAMHALQEKLAENPDLRRYERFYVPADQKDALDPATGDLLLLLDRLKDQAKALKKAGEP